MPRLAALMQRRQTLQRRVTEDLREMANIDRVLFPHIEKLVAAAEGLQEDMQLDDGSLLAAEADAPAPPTRAEALRALGQTTVEAGGDAVLRRRMDVARNRLMHITSALDTTRHSSARSALEDEDRSNTSASAIASVVTEILTARGAPMKIGEIYMSLIERGKAIGGKNPINNLSAHLSNNRDTFVHTPFGWALRNSNIRFPGPTMVQHGSALVRSTARREPGEDGEEREIDFDFDSEDMPRGE